MSDELTKSLQSATLMCPDLAHWWINFTFKSAVKMDLQTELPKIMCLVGNLNIVGYSANDTVAKSSFVISPIGVVCCALALVVLLSKNCENVTFAYHRAVNVADIVWLMFAFENGVFIMLSQQGIHFYGWEAFHTVFGNRLDNSFSDFVELIVTWISIERATIYAPKLFGIINQKSTAYTVTLLLFILAVALVMPYAFEVQVVYDNVNQFYKRGFSAFGLSPGFKSYGVVYNTLIIVRMGLLVAGAWGTIFVLTLISRKKRKLAMSIGVMSTASTSLLGQAKSNQMLCVLQLCESVPLIIKCILILVTQSLTLGFNFDTFVYLNYADAVALESKLHFAINLMVVRRVVEIVSHSMHFVLYCCFSRRMRRAAVAILKNARFNAITTSQNS